MLAHCSSSNKSVPSGNTGGDKGGEEKNWPPYLTCRWLRISVLCNRQSPTYESIRDYLYRYTKFGRVEEAVIRSFLSRATEVCDVINKQSRDVVSYHPRINYVSLLGTETSDDANALADEIALKYLTSNQMHNIQYNVTQKTKSVKFEGVLHDESVLRTPKISMNFLSMNVSCNMSIATKRYMQKYNLLENETRPRRNIPPLLKKDTKIDDAVTANESSDKENERSNILDLNKLKKLPKLM